MAGQGRRPRRSDRIASIRLRCKRCGGWIERGRTYWTEFGHARHPECMALKITDGNDGRVIPRYAVDSPVGKECPGCGYGFDTPEDLDDVVHVAAVPWHGACRVAWTGAARS